jgi:2-polyprenyl-3-methyl-5-hydroxy-6-metoxy-1,4-benzoquinol methylase
MQEAGFAVRGSDISNPAIARLRRRFRAAGCRSTGYVVADVADVGLEPASLDCLVSYGLLHCLRTADRVRIHRALQGSVRPGGLVLFSALLDTRALAPGHLTPGVRLVAMAEVRALFADHDILSWSDGTITEEHPPLVGRHAHDAVWVAARRVT